MSLIDFTTTESIEITEKGIVEIKTVFNAPILKDGIRRMKNMNFSVTSVVVKNSLACGTATVMQGQAILKFQLFFSLYNF